MSESTKPTNSTKTAGSTKPASTTKTTNVAKVSKPKAGNYKNQPTHENTRPQLPPLAIHATCNREVITNFSQAIDFYREEFKKQILQSGKFIAHKLYLGQHIINHKTKRIDDTYMMRFAYDINDKSNAANSVAFKLKDGETEKERHIVMAKYLLLNNFCDTISTYYEKNYGIHCDIFDAGYDKITRKYKYACIKFSFGKFF